MITCRERKDGSCGVLGNLKRSTSLVGSRTQKLKTLTLYGQEHIKSTAGKLCLISSIVLSHTWYT